MRNSKRPAATLRAVALAALAAATTALASNAAMAQSWPTHQVTIVVPYGPGASNDTFSRELASILSKRFGQSFVVDNRPGAGGFTGASYVARAPADGYTLLESPNAIASFKTVMNYNVDPTKDLQAVGMLAKAPFGMVVSSTIPAKTVQEFIDYAKKNPDTTFFGLTGLGTTQQFLSEVFNQKTGLKMKGVNYKSSAETTIDLVAGRIQMEFISVATVIGQVQSGQLRLLGYVSNTYPPSSPPAPLMADAGVPGLEFGQSWWGIFAPKNVPADVSSQINAAINDALKDPAFVTLLAQSGSVPAPMTIDAFSQAVANEAALFGKIVKDFNIKIE